MTMSRSDEDSAHLPTYGSTLLERVVARFEKAWQQGEQPAIDDYLPSEDASNHGILVELVHVDLEFRLKAGEDARVESYVERYPALGEDRSAKCQLIAAEYNFRLRDEQDLPAEQYYARFPDDQDELRELFSAESDSPRRFEEPRPSSTRTHSGLRIEEESLPMSFGRFELLALIGRGTFGAVYRAHDPQLDRDVAIKIPHPRVLETRSQVTRFLREAKTGAKLRHRNICPIYHVGEHQGTYYIVMGFIAGTPLSDFIKPESPIPQTTAARLVLKLTAALADAHQQRIVHRDLKPSNIIIDDKRREPIILDFGLAKDLLNPDTLATVTGEILGTPAYMSPEQARGARSQIGPKSDIYSLGVVLYHLLTGRIPFQGSAAEVVVGVLDEAPEPPSKHRPDLDLAIESICLKAMAKEPSDRFGSMTEFGEALKAYLKDLDHGTQPVATHKKDTVDASPKAVAREYVSTQPTLSESVSSNPYDGPPRPSKQENSGESTGSEAHRTAELQISRNLKKRSEYVDVSPPAVRRNPVESRPLAPSTYLRTTRRQPADNTKLIAIAAAVGGAAIILMLAGILLSQFIFRESSDKPLGVSGIAEESEAPAIETTSRRGGSSTRHDHAPADARITDGAEDRNGPNPPMSLMERLVKQSQEGPITEVAEETDSANAPSDETTHAPSVTATPQHPAQDGIGPAQGMKHDGSRTWNLKDGDTFEAEFIEYDSDSALVTWRTSGGVIAQCRLADLAEEDQEWVLVKAKDAMQVEFKTLVEQARASIGDGDYDRAKSLLTSASRMEDAQVCVPFLLGLLSALVDHDFDKAKTSFAHCVERSPNNGAFLNNLAITEIQKRDFSHAFRHWEDALISQQDDQVLAVIAHNADIFVQYIERHPGAVPQVHKERFRGLRDKSSKLSGSAADSDSGWLCLDAQLDADGTMRPVDGRSIGNLKLEDHQCRFCNVCRGCGLVKCPNTNCRQGYEQAGGRRKANRVPCNTCQGRKSVPCPHCSDGIRG